MSLQWPDAAKKAMAVFFTRWNDIDIFVEDTASHAEFIYRALAHRVLNGKASVDQIFPLGGRKKVTEACRFDCSKTGRPRIYLIDGDLDLLTGAIEPPMPRLFQHQVYAVENYLLSEDALVEILQEENPRLSHDTIRNKLNYPEWIVSISDLHKLFVLFGISTLIAPELPTIGLGIGSFISGGKKPYLDSRLIADFLVERRQVLSNRVNKETFTKIEDTVTAELESADNPIDLLAARDFVFPLLLIWIRSVGLSMKASTEGLQLRLAKVVSLDRHNDFCSAILQTANG